MLQENVMEVLNLQIAWFLSNHQVQTKMLGVQCKNDSKSFLKPLDFHQIFATPWASDEDIEQEYLNCIKRIQDLQMDEITYFLSNIVTLTRPNGLSNLLDCKAVSSVHGLFITLLKRHLHTQTNDDNVHQFSNLVDGYLKKMTEIFMYKRIVSTVETNSPINVILSDVEYLLQVA